MPIFDLADSVPYLATDHARVVWTSGWDALLAASGGCIRVNARGVSVKPPHWAQADLRRLGWDSRPCIASSMALCDTGHGMCFPAAPQSLAVYNPSSAWGGLAVYNPSAAWGGLACSRESDGRALAPENVYDVTSCDALDGGGDLVLCNGMLSFARTDLPPWAYWSVCLLAVYIVRALSYLVLRRVERASSAGQETAEEPLASTGQETAEDDRTVAATACCVVVTLASGWQSVFVTEEEAFAARYALAYVLAYMGMWGWARLSRFDLADPPIYNLIAGTLLFVATRLYAGVETPYNAPLIWAIAARVGTKLRARECVATLVTAPLDALMLSLLCTLGFGFDSLFLMGILAAAFAVGDIL